MGIPAYEGDVGSKILEEIRRRVPESQFHTWFHGLEFRPRRGGRFEIGVPNSFHRSYITDRYQALIEDAICSVCELESVELEFRAPDPLAETPGRVAPPPGQTTQSELDPKIELRPATPQNAPHLRPEYTFERFIAGPANRFALAAAQAVAENPGEQYNPLFLHGSVGLGKTHLLQSIAREFVGQGLDPVVSISCMEFTDDFIAGIAQGRVESFRERYRQADALLIDDIHFLEAKVRTQEEFFHTFNALTNLGRQVVLTSDSPPGEIAGLGERLVSRFQNGLVAQLTPPELETRTAIVVRKGIDQGLEIPTDIAQTVAQRVSENVRELEGAVLRLHSLVHLEKRPLDAENTARVLSELFGDPHPRIDLMQIQNAVIEEFGVDPTDLHSKKRTRSIVVPRQVCMYLARRFTDSSLGEIGLFFGGRDHTTVLHAVQKIERLRDEDVSLRRRIEPIESALLR